MFSFFVFLISARLTASQCLQHSWMQSVTATPAQNPQTQAHEGLNSSTSSLDSAMWLDSPSSLEPSPISSASSSFAPRPNGKGSEESTDQCSNKQQEDMTQVVSKLCTEMQKAGNDSGLLLNSNLDGSASSISSNESCNTLKQEEEDGEGVFIPRSTTPPPSSLNTKRSESSSSSIVEDDIRSLSRPNSGLRVTTPIQTDVVSYAPETLEKLKKLELLKQKKKRQEVEKENQMRERSSTERRYSSPTTSVLSKLKIGSFKLKTHNELNEDKEGERPKSADGKKRVESPIPIRNEQSPVPMKNKQSPVLMRDQQSPAPVQNQHSPVPVRNQLSPVPVQNQQSPILMRNQLSPIPLHCQQQPDPGVANEDSVSKDDHVTKKSSEEQRGLVSKSPIPNDPSSPVGSTRSNSPKYSQLPPSSTTSPSCSSSTTNDATSLPKSNSISSVSNSNVGLSSSSLASASLRSPSPINDRSKSYSPQAVSKPQQTYARHTKSASPANTSIKMRNKAFKQKTRESWRKTPHIDPDAIEALLNLGGEVDADTLLEGEGESKLETCDEEVEPTSKSPEGAEQEDKGKKTPVGKVEELHSILKKGGHSDSDIVRRNGPRRTVMVSTHRRNAKHQSLYFGSPERSPGPQNPPLKNDKVKGLQKSLTMSYSSPDLTALLGNKSRIKKPKREDSYVTGSATPKESNRRSFFGGGVLTRSFTISGKGSKTSPAHVREKYKQRKKD